MRARLQQGRLDADADKLAGSCLTRDAFPHAGVFPVEVIMVVNRPPATPRAEKILSSYDNVG